MNRFSNHQFGRRAFSPGPLYSIPAVPVEVPVYPAAPAYYGNGVPVPVFVEQPAAGSWTTPVVVGGAALLAAAVLGLI